MRTTSPKPSVAIARKTPRSRSTGRPNKKPATPVTAAPASSAAANGHCSLSVHSAAV
jgi:hypothetical protein